MSIYGNLTSAWFIVSGAAFMIIEPNDTVTKDTINSFVVEYEFMLLH